MNYDFEEAISAHRLIPASNLRYQILYGNKYPCRKNIFPSDDKTAKIFVLYAGTQSFPSRLKEPVRVRHFLRGENLTWSSSPHCTDLHADGLSTILAGRITFLNSCSSQLFQRTGFLFLLDILFLCCPMAYCYSYSNT